MDTPITITITKAEALTLFELLADFAGGDVLPIRGDAERLSLQALGAALDKTLAEPFMEGYRDVLEQARKHVVISGVNQRK